MTVRCYWCGSSDVYFRHYACWEEDRVGNAIEVGSMEEAERQGLHVRDEEWWCSVCDAPFGGPVEIEE